MNITHATCVLASEKHPYPLTEFIKPEGTSQDPDYANYRFSKSKIQSSPAFRNQNSEASTSGERGTGSVLGRLDYFGLAVAYRARPPRPKPVLNLQLRLRGGRGRWTPGIALGPLQRSEAGRSFCHGWARHVARSAQEQDPSLRSPHVVAGCGRFLRAA